MKLVIAGSRYGVEQKFFDDCMKRFCSTFIIEEVVSGCALGVDTQAIEFAITNNIKLKKFPADWVNLGRAAGPIRNEQMAQYGDYLVAFFNKDNLNLGTKNMIGQMKKLNKPYLIFDERLFEDRAGQMSIQIPSKSEIKRKSLVSVSLPINPDEKTPA